MTTHRIRVTVNGISREAEVEPRLLFVHFLRDVLRMILGALTLALLAWLSLQPALWVDRAWDAADRPGGPSHP